VYTCTLRDVHNKVDIGVIVVVGSTRDFYISVSHPDVFGIDSQILWRGHDGEFDCALGTKGLVGPFSNRSDLLDGGNTVVCDQDL
jgi:hypothetical protein